MLAMHYMPETRLSNKKACPLLSCADMEVLLSHFFSGKDITETKRFARCKPGIGKDDSQSSMHTPKSVPDNVTK